WGRKPPLLTGIGLYTVASFLCALAPRVEWLIFLRALQGLGACAGPLIARAVVRDVYDRQRSARMLSLMMLVGGAAPLLGPLIGARLLVVWGWRAIFGVLSGFGLLCLLAARLGLPETLETSRRSQVSLLRAVGRYATLLRDPVYLGYSTSSAAAYAGLFAYF